MEEIGWCRAAVSIRVDFFSKDVYASEKLHENTRKYLISKSEIRYSKLYQFFSVPGRVMIPPIIQLMSDYAKEPGLE